MQTLLKGIGEIMNHAPPAFYAKGNSVQDLLLVKWCMDELSLIRSFAMVKSTKWLEILWLIGCPISLLCLTGWPRVWLI